MKLFSEEFSIAKSNYRVISNFDVHSLLFDPQPYNLHINYLIKNKIPQKSFFTISILKSNKKLSIVYSARVLKISGNINPMFTKGYNPQFGLFGNKGLINRFILHTLEHSASISIIHACAIIHPSNNNVCIAIGASGSGKSVFVSNALKIGWGLIATEQVLISTDREVFLGNQYDNVSPKAIDFIEKELKEAVVQKNKTLVEPIGSKIFVDLSKYSTKKISTKLRNGNFTLIVLNFGDYSNKTGSKIIDNDFILREMQYRTSEKICSPIIFNDKIFDLSFNGNPDNRTFIVNSLIAKAKDKIVLGGNYSDFESWLKNEYED